MIYGEGISREGSVLDMAVAKDIVQKSGSWSSYNETRIGQGKENARQFLKDNPELCDELEAKVRATLNPQPEEEQVENAPEINE